MQIPKLVQRIITRQMTEFCSVAFSDIMPPDSCLKFKVKHDRVTLHVEMQSLQSPDLVVRDHFAQFRYDDAIWHCHTISKKNGRNRWVVLEDLTPTENLTKMLRDAHTVLVEPFLSSCFELVLKELQNITTPAPIRNEGVA